MATYRYKSSEPGPKKTPLKERIQSAYPKTTLESRIMTKPATEAPKKKPTWKSYGSVPVGGAGGKAKLLQAGGKF